MKNFAELQDRIAKLPPSKADEYGRVLHGLMTRSATDADWQKFEARLRRAEYLSGSLHHSAPVRLRGGH